MRQTCEILVLLIISLGFSELPAKGSEQWQPISKADLELNDAPEYTGAQAVILYRSVDRHDDQGYQDNYIRIKILTQEGTKYANVQTPSFDRDHENIGEIRARTINPDGSIIPFTGRVFEKLILKNRSLKQVSLAFTMPAVQVGSIIEYQYRQRYSIEWSEQYGTEWRVQDELYVKKAKFSLRPSTRLRVKWVAFHLMEGATPKKSGGNIVLTVQNVPPFDSEEYMPPESEVRSRVYFFYTSVFEPEKPEEYWKKNGQEWAKKAERFVDQRVLLQKEVDAVLTLEDITIEAKMRRLYARAQKIRNLSWGVGRSEKEEEREKLRDNRNVDDVLRHGYGTQDDINRLYAGLLREAGIYSALMRVSEREQAFFHAKIPLWEQLDSDIVVARDDKKEYYLDPGTPYCPFGELSWQHTAVLGWRSDTMSWDEVPGMKAEDTTEVHKAQLFLDQDGALSGALLLSYSGSAALSRRLSAIDDDETEKARSLAEEIKEGLPSGAQVQVIKMDGWTDPDVPLTIELSVKINAFASFSGNRVLLPLSIFHRVQRYPFQSPARTHSVYFRFPFREVDDITITLSRGMKMESQLDLHDTDTSFARYSLSVSQRENTLHILREFAVRNLMFSAEDYPKLQTFYGRVKAGDQEEVIMTDSSRMTSN